MGKTYKRRTHKIRHKTKKTETETKDQWYLPVCMQY